MIRDVFHLKKQFATTVEIKKKKVYGKNYSIVFGDVFPCENRFAASIEIRLLLKLSFQ